MFITIDRYFQGVNILADVIEIYRANKGEVKSNNELVRCTPHLVAEAIDLLGSRVEGSEINEDLLISSLFGSSDKPTSDLDRGNWLRILGIAVLGHSVQITSNVYEKNEVRFIKNQLESDYRRWRDTWKERPIEGQLERTYERFRDYRDQHNKGGVRFPWLKVAGGIIINLYRLDNPDYQE
ncbi:MAG: hypothetical protein NT162_00010 [Candidatus Woesebacteria bacterium]|nr:hypothetical protein [Candidatus Woesebacteria bacterium]